MYLHPTLLILLCHNPKVWSLSGRISLPLRWFYIRLYKGLQIRGESMYLYRYRYLALTIPNTALRLRIGNVTAVCVIRVTITPQTTRTGELPTTGSPPPVQTPVASPAMAPNGPAVVWEGVRCTTTTSTGDRATRWPKPDTVDSFRAFPLQNYLHRFVDCNLLLLSCRSQDATKSSCCRCVQ